VWVKTSGGDPDVDGYDIVIDTMPPNYLRPNETVQVRVIKPGPHSVTLERVAENCSVTGGQTRLATVTTDRPAEVMFEVVCVATGVAVTATTSGQDHPNNYRLSLDGRPVGTVDPNGSIVVGRLGPGPHKLSLTVPGSTCSVAGENQITVEVVAGTVTPIQFQITCVAPIRLPKIAYQLDTVFNDAVGTAIAVVNLDGSGAEVLELGSSASWSPDGTRLIFSDARCDDYSYYYYYYYDCSGGLLIMDPESWSSVRPPGGAGMSSPAWAPTGDAIAAANSRSLNILTMDALHPTSLPLPNGVGVGRLTWSPEGRRIAFTCDFVAQRSSICVVNRDGTGFTRLMTDTTGATAASDPAWSPDGKRIAFTRDRDVALLTLDGGGVVRLTEGSEPAWSPDGSRLVFVGKGGLFTISADGSDRRQLTTGNHHAPAWRP
jgi:WD40 repeat protein